MGRWSRKEWSGKEKRREQVLVVLLQGFHTARVFHTPLDIRNCFQNY